MAERSQLPRAARTAPFAPAGRSGAAPGGAEPRPGLAPGTAASGGGRGSGRDARGGSAAAAALPGPFEGRSIASSSCPRPLPSHRHGFHGPCTAWRDPVLFAPLVPSLSPCTRQRLLMVL